MNSPSNPKHSLMTLANLLTCFRFASAPVLLWLAWHGYGVTFLVLLGAAFLTDACDGIVARWTGTVSQFGARLDSWADMVNYCTIALGSWWLWPEMLMRESIFATIIVLSYLLPALVGIIKFGTFTSYHTWTVKCAAVAVGLSLYILFLGGTAWPFRVAAFISMIAATEEISISMIAPEPYSNVSSIWDVKRRLAVDREPSETDANS
jgi:phosphatidylserine synthase